MEDRVFVNVVNRFEKLDREDDASADGSSTSICSNSLRRLSVDSRSELPFDEGRKSRLELDRTDSTVGGWYPTRGGPARWPVSSRPRRPCRSASSLASSGPRCDSDDPGLEDVASSYVGIGSDS